MCGWEPGTWVQLQYVTNGTSCPGYSFYEPPLDSLSLIAFKLWEKASRTAQGLPGSQPVSDKLVAATSGS